MYVCVHSFCLLLKPTISAALGNIPRFAGSFAFRQPCGWHVPSIEGFVDGFEEEGDDDDDDDDDDDHNATTAAAAG